MFIMRDENIGKDFFTKCQYTYTSIETVLIMQIDHHRDNDDRNNLVSQMQSVNAK